MAELERICCRTASAMPWVSSSWVTNSSSSAQAQLILLHILNHLPAALLLVMMVVMVVVGDRRGRRRVIAAMPAVMLVMMMVVVMGGHVLRLHHPRPLGRLGVSLLQAFHGVGDGLQQLGVGRRGG